MLFVGDDWAEDHHDVEVINEAGTVLAKKRVPEGLAGVTALHAVIAEHLPDPGSSMELTPRVVVGIETDRGPWVSSLLAAGYEVYAINPLEAAHYRRRHSTSGAKSDAADAHLLAEIVRIDRHNHQPIAGDSALAEAIKLAARAHQGLIWERTRHMLRLRSALREFFPVALKAFDELNAPDALELLSKAPDPDSAARLPRRSIVAAFTRANRRDPETRADAFIALVRAEELRQPDPIQAAYAGIVRAEAGVIAALNTQIEELGQVVEHHFGQHPAAEVIRSLPGLGPVLSARLLGEFGDDPDRYADAKARKAFAGTAPVTRASGTKKVVLARYARNKRLGDAAQLWAFSSMRGSPGAKTYYQQIRARGTGHQAALRQLANRWVGILHGCMKTGTLYDEKTAWAHILDRAA
ncbi:MAG: IS110 family transposase [Acidimicrobiales bacterium]